MQYMNLEDNGAMPLKFQKKIISNLDYSAKLIIKPEDRIKMFFNISGLTFCLLCTVSQEATAIRPPSK